MSTDLDASFNEQFMNINMKLKRRFMRKPNLAECTKEFLALGVRCEYSDQPTFAGHAYVGAAKCAASAGNILEEADHYMTAGKQFMKAEKKLRSLKFHSPDRENLEAAVGCYTTAFNKYPENSMIRSTIYLRLAQELVLLGHIDEALHYYTEAIEHVEDITMKQTCFVNRLITEIECGKYEQAWNTVNDIMSNSDGVFEIKSFPRSYIAEIQIDWILLTLLIKPSKDSEPASLKQLFTDLMNDNESEKFPFCPDLRLKLQSIVSCATSGDVQTLVVVASDAARFLTILQDDLLQTIITRERAEHLAIT